MTPWELRKRTAAFARTIDALMRPCLRQIDTRDVATQLRRAAFSVASNYRATGRAKSHKDFTSKLATVLEEADEAQGWLKTLRDCKLIDPRAVEGPLKEATELVRIFTAAHETAKRNDNRDE